MVFLGQLVKSLVGRCCLLSVYFNKYWPGRLSAGEELPFHLGFMSSDLSWCNPSWAGTVQWVLPQIHAESVFIEKWCFGADWEFALWKWRNIQRESSGFFQQSDISLNLLVAELKAVSHRFSLLVENSVMKLNCLPGNWAAEASPSMLFELVSRIAAEFQQAASKPVYLCSAGNFHDLQDLSTRFWGNFCFALESQREGKKLSLYFCSFSCSCCVCN